MMISFFGADGAGKTSVIDAIMSDPPPGFINTKYIHLRYGIGQSNNSVGLPVVNPHAQKPRGALPSIFKALYFLFDYVVGYILIVRPLLKNRSLVIFDRYYHDILVDPIRYRYGGPMWLVHLVGKLIPLPDMFILLDAPPEILQQRKQEVPIEETKRQREAYLKLFDGMANAIVVDSNRELNVIVADVKKMINKSS